MTALEDYQRLESTGLWRQSIDDDPVEVVISFGTATLVLSTFEEAPLTHWSLSALTQTGTAEGAVIYSPDSSGDETLLITDPDMIGALARVKAAYKRRSNRPGRLRNLFYAGALAAIIGWAVFILPGWIEQHVAKAIPSEQAGLIGDELLVDIKSRVGLACSEERGVLAANKLAAAVPGTGGMKLHVLELGKVPLVSLPGEHVLINKQIIEAAQSPDEIAGWIASEMARTNAEPPLLSMTRKAGFVENLRFLFTGGYTPETSVALVENFLAAPGPVGETQDTKTLETLTKAGISPLPFSEALARGGADALRVKLFAAAGSPGEPVIDDQSWVALQGICD